MTASVKPAVPAELLAECEADPVTYCEHVLGIRTWTRQADVLRAMAESVTAAGYGSTHSSEIAVRAGNGVGKSFILGAAVCWWFDCMRGSAFIASPTMRQCEQVFAYVRSFRLGARYALPGELQQTQLKASDAWWVKLVTARDEVSFQGLHAFAVEGENRPRILGLVEEASGVRSDIYRAIRGCVTASSDLLVHIGNPNVATGDFAACFKDRSVRTFTISALECPNVIEGRDVIPGLVSKRFVDGIARRYGKNSDVYRVRCLGMPPKNDPTAVVALSSWEAAKVRAAAAVERNNGATPAQRGRLRAGLDFSAGGGDSCGWIVRDDYRVIETRKLPGELTISTREASDWLTRNPDGVLAVDCGGIGAGPFQTLEERFGARVVGVNFGSKPVGDEEDDWIQATAASDRLHRYADRRTEIWFTMSAWVRDHAEIGDELDPDLREEFEGDVLAPRTAPQAKGQLLLEKKDVTRKRLGRSPDLGDALALACAADLVVATESAGASTMATRFMDFLRNRRSGANRRRELVGAGVTADTWRAHR